jgi:two-component system alkaline phosphatase synthesis response regulator PhoP
LIVDDEQDLVRPLAFRLEMEGFRVVLEPNGQLGYDRAVAELPDIILLDVMMPGIDGVVLCRMLKEEEATRRIPIIMVSAKRRMGDVEAAFNAHADDYVSKPYEWAELHQKIRKLLG